MPDMNKIAIFDTCMDGQLDKFEKLINPYYNQFNDFYKTYKDTFSGKHESVDNIIFHKNEDSSVSFTVICPEDISIRKTLKTISVEREKTGYKFTVQSNKAQ